MKYTNGHDRYDEIHESVRPMRYTVVRYEDRDSQHMLHVDVDGKRRTLYFDCRGDALAFMENIKVYSMLTDNVA